jgi:hypothetical protein
VDAPQVIAWKPLGELLVDRGLVTIADLDDALEEQTRTGKRLGAILVARRVVAGAVLTMLLAEQVGVELETEGGFGSGLFAEIARRNGTVGPPADKDVATAAAATDASLHAAPAAFDDPAFELTALRAELEVVQAHNVALRAELDELRAARAPKRRAKSNSKAKPAAT